MGELSMSEANRIVPAEIPRFSISESGGRWEIRTWDESGNLISERLGLSESEAGHILEGYDGRRILRINYKGDRKKL